MCCFRATFIGRLIHSILRYNFLQRLKKLNNNIDNGFVFAVESKRGGFGTNEMTFKRVQGCPKNCTHIKAIKNHQKVDWCWKGYHIIRKWISQPVHHNLRSNNKISQIILAYNFPPNCFPSLNTTNSTCSLVIPFNLFPLRCERRSHLRVI